MTNRIVLKFLIAFNWILAGFAFGMFLYGNGHAWSGICFKVAQEDIVFSQVQLSEEKIISESLKKGKEANFKYRDLENLGLYAWLTAASMGTFTAVVLMVVSPKIQQKEMS